MQKLKSLREHILSIPGEIELDAGNLITQARAGSLISLADGTNNHFRWQYRATIIITDFVGDFDKLSFWVLSWLKQNQPDHKQEAGRFEADIIDAHKSDIELELDLEETVQVEQTVDGIRLIHIGEPNVEPVILSADQWSLYIEPGDGSPVAIW
ncbi:MAG: phage tail protein [Gammaproteobacteria bacterium]|nr:phage tail protein [Gammaproteobacteria bacterium]